MRERILRPAWRVLRVLVAVLLIYALGRVAGIGELATLRALRLEWVALAVLLVPLSIWVRAFNHGLLINAHRRLLGPWQLYRLTLVGVGLGLLVPMGAADLLKARYGLVAHGHAEEMVVSSVLDKLTSLTALSLMGIVGAAIVGDLALAAAAALIAVATLVPLAVPTGRLWMLLLRILAPRTELDEKVLSQHSRPPISLLVRVLIVSFGAWVVTYAVVFACCLAVGAPIGVFTVYAIAPLSALVRLIPISVGGIGVGEVTLATLLMRAGVPQDMSAQVALLQMALLVFLPGVVGLLMLARSRTRSRRQA